MFSVHGDLDSACGFFTRGFRGDIEKRYLSVLTV